MSKDSKSNSTHQIRRACGLLVIEVVNSNPNGDPDRDSDPRQRPDGLGEISPVSFKRKLRDIVERKPAEWSLVKERVAQRLTLKALQDEQFEILEKRGRDREQVELAVYLEDPEFGNSFLAKFWDARVFGNTFLENAETIRERLLKRDVKLRGNENKLKEKLADLEKRLRRNIKSGAVQFGMGLSIKPINIRRNTQTNKSGVEEGTEQGMAPLGYRFIPQATYAMPFFVNPAGAEQTRCRLIDIEVMLTLIPLAYPLNPSSIRPMVRVVLAHYLEHENLLGSFSDLDVLRRLAPVAQQPKESDVREEPYPGGFTTWTEADARKFMADYASKFARYSELVSGIEFGPKAAQ